MLQRYDFFFTYSKLRLLFIFDRLIIMLNISFAYMHYSLQGGVKGMPRCGRKTVDNKKATAGNLTPAVALSLKINLAVPIICRIFANRKQCKSHGEQTR